MLPLFPTEPLCRSAAAHEQALARLLRTKPVAYDGVGRVIRTLVATASPREEAKGYFRTAMQLLGEFSAATCPMQPDELQWLLAEAWNRGTQAFKERPR